MPTKIYLSPPHLGEQELVYIQKAIAQNWVAPFGENLDDFEQSICAFTKTQAALALNSGTAAIHLALMVLGVQTGDEVICPTFTFVAAMNPILYQGAKAVLIDSERDTWNMCPLLLEQALTERLKRGRKPKAIVLVHGYGQAAKIEEIQKLAQHFEIPIIEDAAEALGSRYKDKALGTWGDLGVYSFNGNKIITTSAGGMLLSDKKELIDQARYISGQARELIPHYYHRALGYNYRMSNILAGIGLGQMQILEERIQQRRNNFAYYQNALQDIPDIHFLKESPNAYSNYWLSCILVDSNPRREKIRLQLAEEQIESRPLWFPMHQQPLAKSFPYYGKGIAEDLFQRGLCLPSGSNLSLNGKERIVKVIRNCFS